MVKQGGIDQIPGGDRCKGKKIEEVNIEEPRDISTLNNQIIFEKHLIFPHAFRGRKGAADKDHHMVHDMSGNVWDIAFGNSEAAV